MPKAFFLECKALIFGTYFTFLCWWKKITNSKYLKSPHTQSVQWASLIIKNKICKMRICKTMTKRKQRKPFWNYNTFYYFHCRLQKDFLYVVFKPTYVDRHGFTSKHKSWIILIYYRSSWTRWVHASYGILVSQTQSADTSSFLSNRII